MPLTLAPLLPGIQNGSLEVIVVCNGCTDSTADTVRAQSQQITCLETPIPSKTAALNLGDKHAHWFPRIYQDADVVLSLEAVQNLAKILRDGVHLAASPAMVMDLTHASWAVKSYYSIWQKLPYVREGMIGVGVYALSEKGRERFGPFPDIVADDGYVRALFAPQERTVPKNCSSLVRAPHNIGGLLRIKTRSRRGQFELAQRFPHLIAQDKKAYGHAVSDLLAIPVLWPKIAIYLYVNLLSRYLARRG